jgi:hypothetical protein
LVAGNGAFLYASAVFARIGGAPIDLNLAALASVAGHAFALVRIDNRCAQGVFSARCARTVVDRDAAVGARVASSAETRGFFGL